MKWTAAALAERLGGNRQLAQELITIFLDEYPDLLRTIHASVARNDGQAISRSAHAMKGTVSNFIDAGPTATALALERAAAEARLGDVPALVEQLERELAGTGGRDAPACRWPVRRVLIADDDPVLRHALTTHLTAWSYTSVIAGNGKDAWAALQQPDPPLLAVIDWNMPGMDGVDLCRNVRAIPELAAMYLIMLTGNQDQKDVVAGLESGADDYITKPFNWEELRARLRIGSRIVGLQQALATRVDELQQALGNVKRLSGLLPICAYCKKIRNGEDYWMQVERYLAEHSEAEFSHGICPDCLQTQLSWTND
jgi:sigma-B regulation protein RsbU (phosphoserine phosphatase)